MVQIQFNFSPLREGDNFVSIRRAPSPTWTRLFQSPSRRGQLRKSVKLPPCSRNEPISVPFAKGTTS